MKQDFSDMIAQQMKETLESPAHRALFGLDKLAKEKCSKCDSVSCKCTDTQSAKDSKESTKEDSQSAKDSDSKDSADSSCADDANNDFDTSGSKSDSSDADDEIVIALDQALGSLLTASAALDAIGFEKSAAFSLDLANFVVEAKKKAKKKAKKPAKKTDSKKTDSKKTDSKKSDSKKTDSKKSSK